MKCFCLLIDQCFLRKCDLPVDRAQLYNQGNHKSVVSLLASFPKSVVENIL